jgi:hypothetical protein
MIIFITVFAPNLLLVVRPPEVETNKFEIVLNLNETGNTQIGTEITRIQVLYN